MTEQLNQVYAYLLKIEEASRKDVTGIQFAFEAGGYAKAAMAICESALNWPKHSNVEVQANRKTPFDFGAVIRDTTHRRFWQSGRWPLTLEWRPFEFVSDGVEDEEPIKNEPIFLYPTDCQAYCNYLNSLSNEE